MTHPPRVWLAVVTSVAALVAVGCSGRRAATPTPLPSPSPTVAPVAWDTSRATSSATPTLTPTESPTATPSATTTPTDPALEILGPLVPAGSVGRIYSRVKIDGTPATGVFDVRDGSWIGSIPLHGGVAVDDERGRLYVDVASEGLHVLDAGSGDELRLIEVPTVEPYSGTWATVDPGASTRAVGSGILPADLTMAPAVDPSTGHVLLSRRTTLWTLEPAGSLPPMSNTLQVESRSPTDYFYRHPPLRNLRFSPFSGLLHGEVGGRTEWGSFAYRPFAIDLHVQRNGPLESWMGGEDSCRTLAILPDRTFLECNDLYSNDWVMQLADGRQQRLLGMPEASVLWLADRQLLVAQHSTPAGDLLRIDPEDGSVEGALAAGIQGMLSAYDEATGALLSFDRERVHVLPLAVALAPTAELPAAPPRVAITGGGRPLWDALLPAAPLSRFGNAQAWTCGAAPDYATELTLFCAAGGLYRITGHGRRVDAVMHHLPSWEIRDVVVSPAYPRDRTLFVSLDPSSIFQRLDHTLWRSTDAGDTWQPSGMFSAMAFSPSFEVDRTVYAFGHGNRGRTVPANQASVSRDGGLTWRASGRIAEFEATVKSLVAVTAGGDEGNILLALAPTQLLGVTSTQADWSTHRPVLYRSTDEGRSWLATARGLGVSWDERLRILEFRQQDGSTGIALPDWVDYKTGEPDRWTTPNPRPTPTPAPTNSPLQLLETTDLLLSTDLGATWRYVAVEGVPCEEHSVAVDTNQDLVCRDAAGNVRNIADALAPRATHAVPTATPER